MTIERANATELKRRQYPMKQSKSRVTLLLGPQTRLANGLNDAIRNFWDFIAAAGVTAIPNRFAMSTIRAAAAENLSDRERRAILESGLSLNDGNPVFLSAIKLLGEPANAYRGRELFADAERRINAAGSGLSGMVSRVVVTIEPLHHFLFSIDSPALHQRLADTRWETLYELSWSDLVSEVCEAFPSSRVCVVTPDAVFGSARTVLSELFGPAGCEIDPAQLQRPHLTLDGQAALARINATHDPAPDILEQIFAKHRDTPDPVELEARTGIDKLTSVLLDQRFLEDLRELEALPKVRLL